MNNNLIEKVPFISVVFSFRNEEAVLHELILRCRNVFDEQKEKKIISGYELIFVNDDSVDDSENILLSELEKRRDIKIVTMSRNFGVSVCVIAGMSYATGDLIVYMDADLQDPPEVITELIATWNQDRSIDVVHTVRSSRQGETWFKLFLTKIGYLILKHVTDISLPVEAGDFKLLTKRVALQILKLDEKNPFMRGLVCWVGFKQTFISYTRAPRFSGKTKFPVISSKVIWNFFESALISFSDIPLKVIFCIGVLISLFSFLLLLYVLVQRFVIETTSGWTAIMASISFLSGIQLFSMGIIGLYIASIFRETKKRPNYIVKSLTGFDA
ncbi:MAG: glycosyltransferase family 2 protein [Oligoflexia bacterium]|nr:glycosyltransferase family 2 protein [Oligoflexia bacterium]